MLTGYGGPLTRELYNNELLLTLDFIDMSALEYLTARHDQIAVQSTDIREAYISVEVSYPITIDMSNINNGTYVPPVYLPVTPTSTLSATLIFDHAYDRQN